MLSDISFASSLRICHVYLYPGLVHPLKGSLPCVMNDPAAAYLDARAAGDDPGDGRVQLLDIGRRQAVDPLLVVPVVCRHPGGGAGHRLEGPHAALRVVPPVGRPVMQSVSKRSMQEYTCLR